ncbi:MAG: hypothetical protein K6E91_00660 [Butyrivibrio sp.]|nr:hypothetical protein [Butyrivibrio sp.]
MVEYKKGEVPKELLDKAKSLKKSETVITKLDDSDVDLAAGGSGQKGRYAGGFDIKCPICGRSGGFGIHTWEDDATKTSRFYCEGCDYIWAIDAWGNEWDDF